MRNFPLKVSDGTPLLFDTDGRVLDSADKVKGQWRTTPVSLIQAGDWKLMEFLEDGRLELYNLREDLGETRNLAAAAHHDTTTDDEPTQRDLLHELLPTDRALRPRS